MLRRPREAQMKCQHAPCRCEDATVEHEGKKYCSEGCATQDAAGKREEHCACGHPPCPPGVS